MPNKNEIKRSIEIKLGIKLVFIVNYEINCFLKFINKIIELVSIIDKMCFKFTWAKKNWITTFFQEKKLYAVVLKLSPLISMRLTTRHCKTVTWQKICQVMQLTISWRHLPGRWDNQDHSLLVLRHNEKC